MLLSEPVTSLKGVGSTLARVLDRAGIRSVLDLLLYIPRRYDDYSHIVKIAVAKPGPVTVRGKFERVASRYARRGLHVTEAVINDGTGKLKCVWFNQTYRAATLPRGVEVYVSGSLERVGQGFGLSHPSVERVSTFTKNTARIVPTYPETRELSSAKLRRILPEALEKVSASLETLPSGIVSQYKLLGWAESLRQIHFPADAGVAAEARRRLGFDELFALMLAHGLVKQKIGTLRAPRIRFDEAVAKKFVTGLPHRLTGAQKRAVWQIFQDIEGKRPMNRLLQGDVGSGKTVVAAFASLMVISAGYQVAFMAPTEVLARQHADTLSALLRAFGVEVALLVGGLKSGIRKELDHSIKSGQADLVIGTHALIQKGVEFADLGMIVVDEQHRFGVRQRQALVGKGNTVPHLLSMTATPIPRSLALTIYGELDVTVIDEMPPGRLPVVTRVVPLREREKVYGHIDEEISSERQVYLICPLIEDSDVLGVKSVTSEYERLSRTVFKHRRIGLLHGKLKSEEKQSVLEDFKNGRIDILISTTVVEVGVDVPNATILIVEGAERFGLAQLHQLRGRVGRSEQQSYCYLMTSADHMARERLSYMERTNSGFELAEADLQLRGAGEIYGVRQHGELDLNIAKLTDTRLIAEVQKAVKWFIDNKQKLNSLPLLEQRVRHQTHLAHLN